MSARRTLVESAIGRFLCAAAVLCATAMPAEAAEVYRADEVKAAFLYRFAGCVDWPPDALSQPMFTIAVLDADAVAEELGRMLPDRTIKNLPSQVRAIHSVSEAAGAQMLYVGPAFSGELAELIASLKAQPVLIVTDREHALDEGSAVNFMLVDRRVRFEISLPAAAQAGLKVGSALLSVAARVKGGPRSDLFCLATVAPTAPDWLCTLQAMR